jgi:tRNA (pseudouridine54-N1)-methyltransferase
LVEFIVRARAAPTDADQFLAAIGAGQGIEYLAAILTNGLFVSKGHRRDASVSLVLEKSADFSRVLTFSGEDLGSLENLHERALLGVIADALRVARDLTKEATAVDARGIGIRLVSFERLVKEKAMNQAVFLLDQNGEDVRTADIPANAVFVMTDHTPMPKNTYSSMARQGVGPIVLHASQCITLVHDELDRRQALSRRL